MEESVSTVERSFINWNEKTPEGWLKLAIFYSYEKQKIWEEVFDVYLECSPFNMGQCLCKDKRSTSSVAGDARYTPERRLDTASVQLTLDNFGQHDEVLIGNSGPLVRWAMLEKKLFKWVCKNVRFEFVQMASSHQINLKNTKWGCNLQYPKLDLRFDKKLPFSINLYLLFLFQSGRSGCHRFYVTRSTIDRLVLETLAVIRTLVDK